MNTTTQKAYRSLVIKLILTNLCFFAALFSFFFFSNYQLKEKSAQQITNVIAGQYKAGQLRDVIKALNLVKEDTFEAVGLFDKDGKRIITLPSKVDPDHFKNKGFFVRIFYNQIDKVIFYDEDQSKVAGVIKFEFNTWKTFYTSFGVWILFVLLLLPVYRKFFRAVVAQTENEAVKREAEAVKKVSSQVWHDLGQPLQLLTAIIENSKTISEIEKGQLLNVAEEVEKIGGELRGIENKVAQFF